MSTTLVQSVQASLTTRMNQRDQVVDAPVPSPVAIAKARVNKMIGDDDVKGLSTGVREATERFALEIVRSFPFGESTAIAIFGDSEEEVGEITLVDRISRKEMQVTVRGDGLATIWMRTPSSKHVLNDIPSELIPLLPAVLFALA